MALKKKADGSAKLDVDLEASFSSAMCELKTYVRSELAAGAEDTKP